MDALVACDLANRPDCLRMIVERAVVHRPAMRAEIVDVPVAHAEIEGEDVGEALVVPPGHQVPMLRHDEHVAGGGEAVDDHDHEIGSSSCRERVCQYV